MGVLYAGNAKKEPAATKSPRLAETRYPLPVPPSVYRSCPILLTGIFIDLFWKHPKKHRIGGKNTSDAVLFRRFQNRPTNTNSDDRFSQAKQIGVCRAVAHAPCPPRLRGGRARRAGGGNRATLISGGQKSESLPIGDKSAYLL